MTDTTTTDTTDLVINAFHRLATALRQGATELRGPVLARDCALWEAGEAADEIANLIADEMAETDRQIARALDRED